VNERHGGELALDHRLTAVFGTVIHDDDFTKACVDIILKAAETMTEHIPGVPIDDDNRYAGWSALSMTCRTGTRIDGVGHNNYLCTLIRTGLPSLADFVLGGILVAEHFGLAHRACGQPLELGGVESLAKTKPLSARFSTRHNIWYREIRRFT
jgi:hypothetical protein